MMLTEKTEFTPIQFGAAADGKTLDTKAIQKAIDQAAAVGGLVRIPAGIYLTGSLFLKSNVTFHMEEGAVILGASEECQYPVIPSRVAGIEMKWPAGVMNVIGQKNVKITGKGLIDGQGDFWWEKYWGTDRHGGMRREYEDRGLRWAVDYDCTRPRNVIVYESENVILEDFSCERSAFWNIHLCYSSHVHVKGLQIGENQGPSTDGIDIDSCSHVLVEKCTISCNDDSICLKAGRDGDGLRVNRVCQQVEIRDCLLKEGQGITLGSETSGGICNVWIHDIEFQGTECGFRIKSAKTRGGLIRDIKVEHLSMRNVREPFSWNLNWNSAYSYCQLPPDYGTSVPDHWKSMLQTVPEELGIPKVRDITVRQVTAVLENGFSGNSSAFLINGYEQAPIENIRLEEVYLEAGRLGHIEHVKNFSIKNVELKLLGQ